MLRDTIRNFLIGAGALLLAGAVVFPLKRMDVSRVCRLTAELEAAGELLPGEAAELRGAATDLAANFRPLYELGDALEFAGAVDALAVVRTWRGLPAPAWRPCRSAEDIRHPIVVPPARAPPRGS